MNNNVESDPKRLIAAVDAHPDYEAIQQEIFFEQWESERPIFELETDDEPEYRVEVTNTNTGFVVSISGGKPENRLPIYYRLSSDDIKESLRVFEQEGFEHVVTGPPNPDEDPFQQDLSAMLGKGWEVSDINVPNRTACASKRGCCLSILDGPEEWVHFPDDTKPYALVLTEDCGQDITLLAAGLDGRTVLQQWKRYMHAHPETRSQEDSSVPSSM